MIKDAGRCRRLFYALVLFGIISKLFKSCAGVVLYSVMFFGTLTVVPLVHGSYKISGDPSDPLEGSLLEFIVKICIISVKIDVQALEFSVVLLL